MIHLEITVLLRPPLSRLHAEFPDGGCGSSSHVPDTTFVSCFTISAARFAFWKMRSVDLLERSPVCKQRWLFQSPLQSSAGHLCGTGLIQYSGCADSRRDGCRVMTPRCSLLLFDQFGHGCTDVPSARFLDLDLLGCPRLAVDFMQVY